MTPAAYQLGALAAFEKFGMAVPKVTAGTIGQEYASLAAKYPHLTGRRPTAPTGANAERAMLLQNMRARVTGPTNPQVAAAQKAEADARSGALQRAGQVRLATDMSSRIRRLLERRPDLKHKFPKYAAAVSPGRLPFGAPPVKPMTANQNAAAAGAAPKPITSVKPVDFTRAPTSISAPRPAAPSAAKVPGVPPVAKPQEITAKLLGADSQRAVEQSQKLGEWSLRPKARLPPGRIHPDNGTRTLGTNFDLPRNGSSSAVSQAFDALRTQRNTDPSDPIALNALNEGVVPTIGA
jgi:hypothetical protein